MMQQAVHKAPIALALLGGVAACAPAEPVDPTVFEPEYLGVQTRLLDDDLVNMFVTMRGARERADVAAYAECAAAEYTLIRGYNYLRHLRTNIDEKNGQWRGDAIYTISAERPLGLKTIDARAAVAGCVENGIPRV